MLFSPMTTGSHAVQSNEYSVTLHPQCLCPFLLHCCAALLCAALQQLLRKPLNLGHATLQGHTYTCLSVTWNSIGIATVIIITISQRVSSSYRCLAQQQYLLLLLPEIYSVTTGTWRIVCTALGISSGHTRLDTWLKPKRSS